MGIVGDRKIPFLLFTLPIVISYTLFVGTRAFARPEFAVRYGINRCTACHYSPAGGGPRTLYGKYFGAFGYKGTGWADEAFAGGEVKMLYFRADHSAQTRGGLGLMNGEVWAALPLRNFRAVLEQNFGGFSPGPRQWYVRMALSDDSRTSWSPQYVLVGRFIPAFGIMTDEHRTYVRMQTGTPWNGGFETGVMMSANPAESWHYDLAIVNGRQNAGTAPTQGMANIWGEVLNLRWLSPKFPAAFGASDSLYSSAGSTGAAQAFSLYTLISVHRMTDDRIPMTISAEFDQAQNWNPSFTGSFVSDANYAAAVAGSTSQGQYALVSYDLTRRLSLQYKFDRLVLDRHFPADAYIRHGIGLKYYFGNNMWAMLRYEFAAAGHPSEKGGLNMGALNDFFALMSLSI